jgi:DNA-binding transcriptional LysR family regulator
MKFLAVFALAGLMHPAKGHLEALFFISHDCPISNRYSHEIRRICDDYAQRGLDCALVYVDPGLSDAAAARHADEYGHGTYPKVVDRNHALVAATGATVTPEVVLLRPDTSIVYRGRIDNSYAALGRPRTVVTEHDFRDALDAVLSGKPVAKPETSPIGCYIPR